MSKANNGESLILHRITISKERFDSMPEPERLLFIRSGHLVDEINTLRRVFLWSKPSDNIEEEEVNAQYAQCLVIARVLTGKLYEAHRIIKGHFRKIAKKYDSLLDNEARGALENLKHYFSTKPNLIETVRNKYAFHYAHDDLTKCLNKISPEDDLVFYLSHDLRNHFFCSADVLVNSAMLEAIEPGNPSKAEEKLKNETIQVADWLSIFLTWYMGTVMMQYFGKSLEEMKAKEIRIPNPQKDTAIKLPYFVSFEESK